MAVWSLSCFFVSASTSPWISAMYPSQNRGPGRRAQRPPLIPSPRALSHQCPILKPNLCKTPGGKVTFTLSPKRETRKQKSTFTTLIRRGWVPGGRGRQRPLQTPPYALEVLCSQACH